MSDDKDSLRWLQEDSVWLGIDGFYGHVKDLGFVANDLGDH